MKNPVQKLLERVRLRILPINDRACCVDAHTKDTSVQDETCAVAGSCQPSATHGAAREG